MSYPVQLNVGDMRALADRIKDGLRMKFRISDPADATHPNGRAAEQKIVDVIFDEIRGFFNTRL